MGTRIKAVRQGRAMSMRDLAREAQIALSTLYEIEAGKAAPRLDTLERIAKALQVKVKDLLQ
jgi:transcriptional regulator with XRE-family HTH domain